MFRNLVAGALAGAAGTAALNAATYVDMALRGRSASETPQRTVQTVASRAHLEVPGAGETKDNRLDGLGALGGIVTGVGIGTATGLISPLVNRLPLAFAGAAVGALAMAATDVPMTGLGVADPSSWSAADWLADALPHLAYGLVTALTLRTLRSR